MNSKDKLDLNIFILKRQNTLKDFFENENKTDKENKEIVNGKPYENWTLFKQFYPDTNNDLYNTLLRETFPTLKIAYPNINLKQRISLLFIEPRVWLEIINDGKNKSVYYNYANLPRIDWNQSTVVLKLRTLIEDKLQQKFDYSLLNFYLSGESQIAYHSDKEALDSIIASYSLGESRDMCFRRIGSTKPEYRYTLKSGNLLVMDEKCQKIWEHSIVRQSHKGPRFNLTFRKRN